MIVTTADHWAGGVGLGVERAPWEDLISGARSERQRSETAGDGCSNAVREASLVRREPCCLNRKPATLADTSNAAKIVLTGTGHCCTIRGSSRP